MPAKKLLPNKILIVVGPTSSGKSELAVKLARRFHGEIISCDSRQIYRGLNLGSGKVEGKWLPKLSAGRHTAYIYKGVIHHLIDVANPKRQFSAAMFQKRAKKIIADIAERGELPILCGGTGQWIDAVVYNQPIPDVQPDFRFRARLEKKSAAHLYQQLKKTDPARAETIDPYNKRRLIRALEIIAATGRPVTPLPSPNSPKPNAYDPLWLGISAEQTALYQKIDRRLNQRLRAGLIQEVKRLQKNGLSWKRLESLGLEYKFIALYLQRKISYDEMLRRLSLAIKHYSKRQLTWWKRNKNIQWIKNYPEAVRFTKKFLS